MSTKSPRNSPTKSTPPHKPPHSPITFKALSQGRHTPAPHPSLSSHLVPSTPTLWALDTPPSRQQTFPPNLPHTFTHIDTHHPSPLHLPTTPQPATQETSRNLSLPPLVFLLVHPFSVPSKDPCAGPRARAATHRSGGHGHGDPRRGADSWRVPPGEQGVRRKGD